MAIDRWRWPVQIQDGQTANPQYSVRKVSFGDGYDQVAENGINSRRISTSISDIVDKKTAQDMIAFLGSHVLTPFIYPVPIFGDGLYQVEATSINCVCIGPAPGGGRLFHVTASLTESAGFGGGSIV